MDGAFVLAGPLQGLLGEVGGATVRSGSRWTSDDQLESVRQAPARQPRADLALKAHGEPAGRSCGRSDERVRGGVAQAAAAQHVLVDHELAVVLADGAVGDA